MKYARDNNGTLEYPKASEFVGIPNWWQHDYQLRKRHYMPMTGTPEDRAGYEAVPATWITHISAETRMEEQLLPEDVYEADPVTGEQVKTGTRLAPKRVPVTVDTSYIEVTSWDYERLDDAEEEPVEPIVEYSKYKLKLSCERHGVWEAVKSAIEDAGKWESFLLIQSISSDNEEFQAALPGIRQAFGEELVNTVLSESIAD